MFSQIVLLYKILIYKRISDFKKRSKEIENIQTSSKGYYKVSHSLWRREFGTRGPERGRDS